MEISEELNSYIENHSQEEETLLQNLDRETHLKMLHPRMLSGKLQGQILESFSRMIQPERILELGTYTGYSAICLSKGLKENGKLITIDIDDETVILAKKYFEKANILDKVEVRIGDALEEISDLDEMFDLVFMDADKSQYFDYYEAIVPKLKPGGYIIADNVLWSGKVIKEVKSNDHFTKGILKFNERVQNDNRVHNYIMPIRDGMTIIRKL